MKFRLDVVILIIIFIVLGILIGGMICSTPDRIIKENLSVRDLEEIAKGNNIDKLIKVKRTVKESDREYKYAEELLCEKLDSKVRVYKNKIEVKFSNAEDLNRILELMNIGK